MIYQTSPKPKTNFPYARAQHPEVVRCPLDRQQPQPTAINKNVREKGNKDLMNEN